MTDLLEDEDGAPFGPEVQQPHQLAVEEIEAEKEKYKQAYEACRNFMVCEMEWEYFRAEFLSRGPEKTAHLQNAKKLSQFIQDLDLPADEETP